MWLSLLIRIILENERVNLKVIKNILNGLRSQDRYLNFIKECSPVTKKEILDPIFLNISHSDFEKIRNDIIHRGFLVSKIEIVKEAVLCASRFLPTFANIINKHFIKS